MCSLQSLFGGQLGHQSSLPSSLVKLVLFIQGQMQCLSFISCSCNKNPRQKQLKEERAYVGLDFQETQSIMMGKAQWQKNEAS